MTAASPAFFVHLQKTSPGLFCSGGVIWLRSGIFLGVDMRLFGMFEGMESRCTLCIARAKEGMGEEEEA
jgi:hypothetical protein